MSEERLWLMAARTMQVQLVELEEVVDACDRLARAILKSGFRPDLIVAIARGGFMPARFLCDFLRVGPLTSFRVQHYQAGGHKQSQAKVTIPLSITIKNMNVLLVDDVNDSGKTLDTAISHLQSFSPAAIRTAVLHEKADTLQSADFKAITIQQWRWILYPWAVVEDVGQFIGDMRTEPRSVEEIRRWLIEQYGLILSEQQLNRVLSFAKTGFEAQSL